MADVFSPEKRSAVMSRIRGGGTKPELAVRVEDGQIAELAGGAVAGVAGHALLKISARCLARNDNSGWTASSGIRSNSPA